MICKSCKAENREESLYCGDCGARIQLLTPVEKKVWAAVAAAAVLGLAYWVFWLRPAQQAKEYAGLMARSDARMKEGKFAEAGESCRRALEIRPNDARARACETKAAAEAKARAEEQVRAAAEAKARAGEQVRAAAEAKARAEEQVRAAAEAKARAEEQVKAAEAKAAAAIKWVTIPGGSFAMGYGADDGWSFAKPIHQVAVKPFQMAKTLVTVAQYKACVDAGACAAPATGGYCNWGVAGRDQHPVNCVDWNQAQAFSAWAGGRLPSESEWEYAARSAGKDWKYPWGDEAATCETAVISGCTSGGTAPVCSEPAGNTKQGLCDMAGNVWEWVQDWYHDSYNGAPTDGTAWESPAGSFRVFRGGSWGVGAVNARSADRNRDDPGDRRLLLGFRPARRGP